MSIHLISNKSVQKVRQFSSLEIKSSLFCFNVLNCNAFAGRIMRWNKNLFRQESIRATEIYTHVSNNLLQISKVL